VADLPRHIAQRECEVIQRYSKWPEDSFVIEESTEGFGPGNVVLIEVSWRQLLGFRVVVRIVAAFSSRLDDL